MSKVYLPTQFEEGRIRWLEKKVQAAKIGRSERSLEVVKAKEELKKYKESIQKRVSF